MVIEVERQKLRKMYLDLLQKKKGYIEKTAKEFWVAANTCKASAAELAAQVANEISSLRETATHAANLNDISKEDLEEIRKYTNEMEEDLSANAENFRIFCKCQLK